MELTREQQAVLSRAYARWDVGLSVAEREQRMAVTAGKIEALAAPLRSVFILRYVQGVNVTECAQRLGMTTAEVQAHILAALRALRDQD